MKNIELKVEEDKLIITVDLTQEHGPSKSGKTIVVASTGGNVSVPEKKWDHVKVGVNVYKYK